MTRIKSGVSAKCIYNKYRVIGVAQNGTKKPISKPSIENTATIHIQSQKLRQKSQSSISATIEIPILSW